MIKTPHSRIQKSTDSRSSYRARSDTKTSAVVEKAVELQSMAGTAIAAGFLSNRSVSPNVIDRVLLESRRRTK